MFSKKIGRSKLLDFFATQPSCKVALEACGGAHHWARQLTQLGHEVRLIPPAYAEAFCEAIPRCRVELLPDCGHMAPLERPDAVAAAVTRFLEEAGGA